MKAVKSSEVLSDELKLAIGLVWGCLNTRQFEAACRLAHGCLAVWPGELRLSLMAAYASVEMQQPLEPRVLQVLDRGDCKEWSNLVYRRAGDEICLKRAGNA